MPQVQVYVRRTADGGWLGVVDLPTLPPMQRQGPAHPSAALVPPSAAKMRVTKRGKSKAKAAAAAARGARQLLKNPLVRSLLPPGVGPALSVAESLASNPIARRVVGKYGKKGLRMLKRAFS